MLSKLRALRARRKNSVKSASTRKPPLSEEEANQVGEQFVAAGKQLSDFMVRVVNFKARFEKRVQNLATTERLKASASPNEPNADSKSVDSNSTSSSQAEACLEKASLFLKRLMDLFDSFFDPNYMPDGETGNTSFVSSGRNSSVLIIEEHLRAQGAQKS